MFFFWEGQEIEKQRGISESTQDRRTLTLLLESEPREENGKELEAEDDLFDPHI